MFTIFLCVWTSIHPNISGADDSGWQYVKRQLMTMIYAVIAPEVVAMWALRQYFAAQKIAEMYNLEFCGDLGDARRTSTRSFEAIIRLVRRFMNFLRGPQSVSDSGLKLIQSYHWSNTHGFFVQMGGFVLHDPLGKPRQVLDYDTLAQLLRDKAISLSEVAISEREIRTRSKADSLSKSIVVFQTTWFTVQIFSRMKAGLPLSPAEIFSLAFAVLNAAIYAIWWEKPQGVELSIPLRLRVTTRDVGTSIEYVGSGGLILDSDSGAENIQPGEKPHIEPTEVWTTQCRHGIWRQEESLRSNSHHPRTSPSAFLSVVARFCNCSLLPLRKMALSESIPPNALRVPMFYAYQKWRNKTTETVFIGPIMGVIFGAVHLLAWSDSSFPSFPELILWRTSAVAITTIPALVVLLGLFDNVIQNAGTPRYTIPSTAFAWAIPLYVVSRLILIVLAFSSLRALPRQAFIEIPWTSYIPHL
ncbi:hypothetical protein D9619_012372 [Psilocybe cf. subviscida]|uniref:Uncharacterized protein n=1 Tax=Psilocybe cf. subviscida TaxID=2480587 RepID=A0A8H5AQU3_9AGAR|nr:hypothetical protein D9619_012372 [Psilocybe cf. subviscida]